MADRLNFKFTDLDTEFCQQIENIGHYINKYGYEKYCHANSNLFYRLLDQPTKNIVFALSSGFLVHENLNHLTAKHQKTLKQSGISILLLPSKSIEESTNIVVERQLTRGFGLKRDREIQKFTQRYPIYKKYGDIKIFSYDRPEIIAQQMNDKLNKYFNP